MFRLGFLSRFAKRKPRILLLVDRPGWAFDHSAKEIVRHLGSDFHFDIRYVIKQPKVRAEDYDLVYVFFWGEELYRGFGFRPEQVIKEVSSHRWEDNPLYGPCTAEEFSRKYLLDAGTVICTSLRLHDLVREWHPHVFHTPNGFNPARFRSLKRRQGPLRIGWAGNIKDPVKRFNDLLEPACRGEFELTVAPGDVSHRKMNRFYNEVDVLAVSSRHEGEPLPLIEAMAAGCFPVCVDVGVVPELVRDGENGLVVEATPEAFAEGFRWCQAHLQEVRKRGENNAVEMRRVRSWESTAIYFKRAFLAALELANRPTFRNDDVSADIPFDRFRAFCELFHQHGFIQLHGVTLNGPTCSRYLHEGVPVEFEGSVSMGVMPNDRIRELSRGLSFENRTDLIDYLNGSPDEIALHGLYHTDYSVMSYEEQHAEISSGLEQLRRLFPGKHIRYFIAPFNRTNADTYRVCREFSLTVSAAEGIHLESTLNDLRILPGTWYRYHHHRFYPESTFSYYQLSFELLDRALAKACLANASPSVA